MGTDKRKSLQQIVAPHKITKKTAKTTKYFLELIQLFITASVQQLKIKLLLLRFGNNYMGRVANPAHLLHYKKRIITERQVKVINIII